MHYWIGTTGRTAQLQVIDRNTGRWVWVTVDPINGLIGGFVQPTLLPAYGPNYPPIGRPSQGLRPADPTSPSLPQMPPLLSLPTIPGKPQIGASPSSEH